MRKGRSGESPHGKNCGMKSRLAGAVRCLVHACLTAAANVGALCMKGWRWMLGAFARTRTSAKRTLTNIEGVLVTLALIATLGIASPLAAGAVEPVEDPTPVSGVLDADGAQIADAGDSDDVTDESDVADSDEIAKDDASADQDATEGDAADEATENADADADAGEKDVSTDGGQSEDTVELEERAEEREGDVVSANKELADSRLGGRTVGTTNRTFLGDGGQLNLGYLFSRYNVIALENAELSHTIGPVLIGGDYNQSRSPINIGDGDDPNNPDNDKPKYRHEANSYIKGKIFKEENGKKSKTLTEVIPNNSSIDLFLGMVNQEFVTDEVAATIFDSSKNNGDVYLTDQYLIFSDLKEMASRESGRLKNSSDVIDTGLTIHANQWDNGRPVWSFAEAATNNAWQDGKKLVLKAGKSYIINADALSYMQDGSSIDKEIIIDASGVVGLDGKVYEGGDASKLPETVITVVGTGGENGVLLPGIAHVKYTVAGVEHTIQLENAIADGGKKEANSGLPLVWNLPDAAKVTNMKSPAFGHVIAPEAEAHITGDYNGCWLVKTINADAEGHMWPYNGRRLSVHTSDKFTLRANKAMIGRSLKDGEFTFRLWEANANWGHSGGSPIQTTTNDANGAINFNEITVTRNTVPVQWSCLVSFFTGQTCTETKTLRYLVEEVKPNNADSSITYDATVFRVEVSATLTADYSKNPFDPDTTIVVAEPVYTPVNVSNNAEHLQGGKPLFTNKVKTTKLKVKKEVPGGDAGNETFTFDVTLTLPYGTDPNALSGLNTTSTSSTAGKIFFDADESHTGTNGTYGYACMPNSAQTACLTDSSGIVKLPLLVNSADKIDFVDRAKFDIELVPFSQNSPVKYLKLKPKGDNKVPVPIERPSLAGTDFMGYTSVQCPADNQKQCLQKTVKVSMTAGEEKELDKLPVGTTYTVQETNIPGGFALEGYECSTNARAASTQPCSGTLQVNDNGNPVQVSIVVTNKRTTVPLSIMKFVDNWRDVPQGNDQDTTFGFSVSLYDKNGDALNNVTYPYKVYEGNKEVTGASGTLTCSTANGSTVGTCGTLELKHNQTAVIEGLPYGTRFVVKEQTPKDPFKWDSQEVTGISSTSGCKDSDENGKCAVTSAGVLVKVHNRYELRVVLPETGGKAHPFMTMLFGVGVVCAGLLITAIYMRRQGMAMLQ